jgi:hypothetical protein
MNRCPSWVQAAIVASVMLPSPLFAGQSIASFQELRRSLKPGDLVIALDVSGNEMFGRVVEIADDGLGLGLATRTGRDSASFSAEADRVIAAADLQEIWRADLRGRKGRRIFAGSSSFTRALGALTPGLKIVVTRTDGSSASGAVASVSSGQFAVWDQGSFTEQDVARIESSERDTLLNGAVVGGAIGTIVALVGVGGLSGPNASDAVGPTWLLSLGAGIGIGIAVDAARKGPPATIYVRRSATGTEAYVQPLFSPKTAGLAMSLRWR